MSEPSAPATTPPAARAARTAARLVCLLAALAAPALAQQDFTKVVIVTHPVEGTVSALEGMGGNIGVSAGPDGLLIVDDQFLPLSDKIHAALDALDGAGAGKPRFVINTHWHGDHVGGNEVFGKEGTIVAQDNVRQRMAAGQELRGRAVPPAPPEALPVITYADALTVHFNGEEIRVRHLPPGHTDGDSMVWFTGSNVVHLGDQFFAGKFPFVDLSSGGSVRGLEKSIGALLTELPADVKVIPGHGPVSDLSGLRAYHDMLVASLDLVTKQLARGATDEEIVAAGMPAEWADWGAGFMSTDEWLKIVAADVRAAPPAAGAKTR